MEDRAGTADRKARGAYPPLTIEQHAVVAAHLAHYPAAARAAVLARLEVGEDEWKDADGRLPEQMARRLLTDDRSLAVAWNEAFVPVKRRLKAERPPLDSLAPLRTAPPPLAEAAGAAADAGSAGALAAGALASGAGAASAVSTLDSASGATPDALAAAPSPVAAAQPRLVDASRPAAYEPPARGQSPWARDADALASMSTGAPAAAPAAPEPPAAGAPADLESLVPPAMRHFVSLQGTQAVADVATVPTLPFAPARPGEPPKAAAVEGPRPRPQAPISDESAAALVPEGMRRFTSLQETQGPSEAKGPVLPFAGRGAPTAARPPLPEASAAAASTSPGGGAGLPSFSLEQYASLCVEIEAEPTRVAETLRRYQITAEQRALLDAHWGERMAKTPEIRVAWSRACGSYKGWLLRRRG